jgi:hypothetical protein
MSTKYVFKIAKKYMLLLKPQGASRPLQCVRMYYFLNLIPATQKLFGLNSLVAAPKMNRATKARGDGLLIGINLTVLRPSVSCLFHA